MNRLLTMLALCCTMFSGGDAWGAKPQDDPFADNACVECHRDLPGRSSEIVDLERVMYF